MTTQDIILKYLTEAGKQNDDVIEFHQQDAMTLAMNLSNLIGNHEHKV